MKALAIDLFCGLGVQDACSEALAHSAILEDHANKSGYFKQQGLQDAFNALDEIVQALAPDAPRDVMDEWRRLYDLMTPEFLARRLADMKSAALAVQS